MPRLSTRPPFLVLLVLGCLFLPSLSALGCGERSTGESGDLIHKDGVYGTDDCIWIIAPSSASPITITVVDLLDKSWGSDEDEVKVYKCASATCSSGDNVLLSTLSRSDIGDKLISSTGLVLVELKGDMYSFDFHLHWTTFPLLSCTGCYNCMTLTAPNGAVSSPAEPSEHIRGSSPKYGANWACLWIIAPSGASNVIVLTFTKLDVSSEAEDYVTVSQCPTSSCASKTQIDRFSGTSTPDPITSDSGVLLIEFNTGDSSWLTSAGSGFEATYTSEATVACAGEASCSSGSYRAYCTADAPSGACAACRPGSFCTGGSSEPVLCPAGTYCPQGSVGSRACEAPQGGYCPAGNSLSTGVLCPRHHQCAGGSAPPLLCTSLEAATNLRPECARFTHWFKMFFVSFTIQLAESIDQSTETSATANWMTSVSTPMERAINEATAYIPWHIIVLPDAEPISSRRFMQSTFTVQVSCYAERDAKAMKAFVTRDRLSQTLRKVGLPEAVKITDVSITRPTEDAPDISCTKVPSFVTDVDNGICKGWTSDVSSCTDDDSERTTIKEWEELEEQMAETYGDMEEDCIDGLDSICEKLGGSAVEEACSLGGHNCNLWKWSMEYRNCGSGNCLRSISDLPVCCSSAKSLINTLCKGINDAKLDEMMQPLTNSTCPSGSSPYCNLPCENTNCIKIDLFGKDDSVLVGALVGVFVTLLLAGGGVAAGLYYRKKTRESTAGAAGHNGPDAGHAAEAPAPEVEAPVAVGVGIAHNIFTGASPMEVQSGQATVAYPAADIAPDAPAQTEADEALGGRVGV